MCFYLQANQLMRVRGRQSVCMAEAAQKGSAHLCVRACVCARNCLRACACVACSCVFIIFKKRGPYHKLKIATDFKKIIKS